MGQLNGPAAELASKIQQKQAVIGVVGLGYVGMPIALEFCKKGFRCIGMDVSEQKVQMLNKGENFIEDLADEEIAEVVHNGLLSAVDNYDSLGEADIIYICVPTPFDANKDPDLTYILSAGEGIAAVLRPGQLLVLKSTTFPGTTEHYLIPVLAKSGLKAGEDFFVAFSPERVDPGNTQWHTGNTPIVTGGTSETGTIVASFANNQIIDQVYMVSSPKVAELEKLLENIFRSVNIALVNELALLCERMGGIDFWEVIEAAGTKPFGFMKFTPGAGVGGHCIPVDPYYLSWLAREHDFETRFITLAANVNESMPYHVAQHVVNAIAREPISIFQAKVLIVGASFKKNVKDIRNSTSEAVIMRLREVGIEQIDVTDPWVEEFPVGDKVYYPVEITEESLAAYDCVVLITDHDAFDFDFIVEHGRRIIDTRNMTRDIPHGREKITVLGVAEPRLRVALGMH
ncbi:MAG: nucleotide sugar dehydrogenase [Bacteroidota bacterium]